MNIREIVEKNKITISKEKENYLKEEEKYKKISEKRKAAKSQLEKLKKDNYEIVGKTFLAEIVKVPELIDEIICSNEKNKVEKLTREIIEEMREGNQTEKTL